MLFPRKKQQSHMYYHLVVLSSRFLSVKKLKLKREILQNQNIKKDLVNIFEDIIQESSHQGHSSMMLPEMQEETDINSLTREDFQLFVYNFFVGLELFTPFPFKYRKDKGCDGYFIFRDKTYMIQVRTKQNNTETLLVNDLREFAGVQMIRSHYKIFVCNCRVSRGFLEEAEEAGIYIIDKSKLDILIICKEILKTEIGLYNTYDSESND